MITVPEFKKLLDQVEETQSILMREYFESDPDSEDRAYAVVRFNNIAVVLEHSFQDLKTELLGR